MKAFFNLMKPRVMSLVIFTCAVGLLIAPIKINFTDTIFSLLAVALGSGAAGALNMWYESDLDSLMTRTCLRPIPTGKLTKTQALIFGILSWSVDFCYINPPQGGVSPKGPHTLTIEIGNNLTFSTRYH